MKKITLLLVLILFSALNPIVVHAQENSVNYTLPYPGILPGNPIYFLKAARDKLSEFFISNPIKKAEFELALADKRVAASILLASQKSSTQLIDTTFSKAENYFELAIGRLHEAKIQGTDITEIQKQFALANLKHQEVLRQLERQAPNQDKQQYIALQKRLEILGSRADSKTL